MTKDELEAIRARAEHPTTAYLLAFAPDDILKLLAEVERLTAERDHFKTQLRERSESLLACREKVERLTLERNGAFRRGAKAMREAAATHVAFGAHPSSLCGRVVCDLANEVRELPIPEDKP